MKPANSILSGFGTTVFEVMTRLAVDHQTINLGQGFPDEDGPDSIKAMVNQSTKEGPNQYPPCWASPNCDKPWQRTTIAFITWTWIGNRRSWSALEQQYR